MFFSWEAAARVVDSVADARDQLLALAEGGEISTGRIGSSAPKLAFVCSGMGPQWWRMCRGLFGALSAFTDTIERCDRELSQYADWSLIDELLRDEASSRLGETEFAQPANFAVQLALAEQLVHARHLLWAVLCVDQLQLALDRVERLLPLLLVLVVVRMCALVLV